MPVTIEQILDNYDFDPDRVERVGVRKIPQPITIVDPDPSWPQRFEEIKETILSALGPTVLSIAHAGSTSVPGLPAKAVIDIDLTVKDVDDEASYVGPLEREGFTFVLREPAWHQHRFFCQDREGAFPTNLHVWGPDCPEVERHRIFREWLLKTPADLELYAKVKRESAAASVAAGESVMDYNLRKENTIREILNRAFRDLGYIK